MLYISLGVPYIKSVCIKGKEYINTDYKPEFGIELDIPYIKYIKIKGKEYINTDYMSDCSNKYNSKKKKNDKGESDNKSGNKEDTNYNGK